MSGEREISRREFLRFRRTERGKVLELSCQALFMRASDATIESGPEEEWTPSMGEPPAVFHRRSTDELIDSFEMDLRDAQVLRLVGAEWLDNMAGAARIQKVIAAFRAHGGIVESA
jgi:hypothetical protein